MRCPKCNCDEMIAEELVENDWTCPDCGYWTTGHDEGGGFGVLAFKAQVQESKLTVTEFEPFVDDTGPATVRDYVDKLSQDGKDIAAAWYTRKNAAGQWERCYVIDEPDVHREE